MSQVVTRRETSSLGPTIERMSRNALEQQRHPRSHIASRMTRSRHRQATPSAANRTRSTVQRGARRCETRHESSPSNPLRSRVVRVSHPPNRQRTPQPPAPILPRRDVGTDAQAANTSSLDRRRAGGGGSCHHRPCSRAQAARLPEHPNRQPVPAPSSHAASLAPSPRCAMSPVLCVGMTARSFGLEPRRSPRRPQGQPGGLSRLPDPPREPPTRAHATLSYRP